MLLDQIDNLTAQINTLTARIGELLVAAGPSEHEGGANLTGEPAPGSKLSTVERLTEIPGIGMTAAQIILAEIGLDMAQFPTAGHLVSWAKLCPRTVQSGPVTRGGKTGRGNPHLKRRTWGGRHRGRQNRHLPRRTLPAYRQAPRQTQGPGRGRPLHPRHHLAAAFRPHRPIPRPRIQLPRQPHQHRTPDA